MSSKKASKIEEIFTVDSTLCSKCQIDGEGFFNFCSNISDKNEKSIGTTTTHYCQKSQPLKHNVCSIRFRSKHSSNTILCLLRNLMEQSLFSTFLQVLSYVNKFYSLYVKLKF